MKALWIMFAALTSLPVLAADKLVPVHQCQIDLELRKIGRKAVETYTGCRRFTYEVDSHHVSKAFNFRTVMSGATKLSAVNQLVNACIALTIPRNNSGVFESCGWEPLTVNAKDESVGTITEEGLMLAKGTVPALPESIDDRQLAVSRFCKNVVRANASCEIGKRLEESGSSAMIIKRRVPIQDLSFQEQVDLVYKNQ